jgi:YD repeat-containing protein
MNVVQPPVRSRSVLAAHVLGHSGEFCPAVTDLRVPGRGLDLELVRSYRSSLVGRVAELGRGWSFSLARRIELVGDDLAYHDGAGLAHRFVREEAEGYASPAGFYGVIEKEKRGLVIRHRFGLLSRFDPPERGGRLGSVSDRNGNAITLSYAPDRIEVLDTLHRPLTLILAEGRIHEIRDHAGRTWGYSYDADDRLIEVAQPATAAFPAGTSLRYEYDDEHRLVSLTDAKSQTWLTVAYDETGRVSAQRHGSGTFYFEYDDLGEDRVRTTCRLKNGGSLVVEHNPAGNPTNRTLWVRRDAFAPEDLDGVEGDEVPLTTAAVYNSDSELVTLTEPAGNSTIWEYAEDEDDPRNRGNCLRRAETPAPDAPADQPALVTTWTHDSAFQVPLSITDPRGHTTTHRYDARGNRISTVFSPVSVQPIPFDGGRPDPTTLALEVAYAFNSRGQLLRKTQIDGTVTTYEYYPVADPTGADGPGTATGDPDTVCGYLARVVRDATGARYLNEFRWDVFGNLVAVLDGRRNTARRQFDAMGRLEAVIGRAPSSDTIEYSYDRNGNEVESVQPFERVEFDEATGELAARAGELRELRQYNMLDNVVVRVLAGGEERVTERFVRDKDERIAQLIQPNGTVTELEYDERGLVIAATRAAGTDEAVTERRTYTRNGALRTITDGNGGTTTWHRDAYQRDRGFTDPLGTTTTRERDEAGNVVHVMVDGPGALSRRTKSERGGDGEPLLEAAYQYDEWNRLLRMDEAWRDPSGKPLGASGWDGREGVVSTVVEYGRDGLPVTVWGEGEHELAFLYDSLGRVSEVRDSVGALGAYSYDENGNPIQHRLQGPMVDGESAEAVTRLGYDEMDRLVFRQREDGSPERFEYDSFGSVATHVRPSGMVVRLLHDPLGRRGGQVLSTDDGWDHGAQQIARQLEFDEAYRLITHTNSRGHRTSYGYDALDRQTSVIYPDGTEASAEYDANGNVVRTVDAEGTETVLRYDACDRILERRTRRPDSGDMEVDSFEYDALGRLVLASSAGRQVRFTYDSLSHVLTEDQGGRIVRTSYDRAGRPIALEYPGGESIRRTFDSEGRVIEVATATGEPIATVQYRLGDQIARLVTGGAIEAVCTYDAQERLESVTYRKVDDGALVEGYRYARDDAGRIVHEIQLSDGVGQRFWFDGFNRPVRARYGVRDVLDPTSPFEVETSYEWFPDGPWRRRLDTDGNGVVIEERQGTLNERNRYRRLGDTTFEYDAVGNTIRKGTDNPGWCLYTYDGQNRLVKVECFDAHGTRTKTIEYEYDAVGRLVHKVITDAAGVVTETTYVWSGTTLLEEYENGVLVRTYVHSIGSQPARLTVTRGGRDDYLYIHDGRGLVAGLVRAADPNEFAERYGYEITGNPYLKQVDGIDVELPARAATASALWNSILSGDDFGSLMRDWETGTVTGADGRHLDGLIADVLNTDASLNGGVHTTLRTTMGKQFGSFLGMLGLGNSNGFVGSSGPTGQGGSKDTEGSATLGGADKSSGGQDGPQSEGGGVGGFMRDFSLYAAGGDGGTGGAFDFKHATPAPASESKGGATPKDSRIQAVEDLASMRIPIPGVDASVGDAVAGGVKGVAEGVTGPAKGVDPHSGNEAEKQAKEAQEKAKKEQEQKEKEEKEKQEQLAKGNAEKQKKEEEAKKNKSIVEEGDKYSDPDQQYVAIAPSPEQIEMRLNGLKHPVNPNTDGGGPQVDTSSPPPHHGGIDPTLARFDGEVYGGVNLDYGAMKLSTRPIDYHPDREPPTPTGSPTGGGQTDGDHDLP